jgi:hypothetical protein
MWEAVGGSEYRGSAYKLGLASVLECIFRTFVSVSYLECAEKVVWTGYI